MGEFEEEKVWGDMAADPLTKERLARRQRRDIDRSIGSVFKAIESTRIPAPIKVLPGRLDHIWDRLRKFIRRKH